VGHDTDKIKDRARSTYRALPRPVRRISVLLLGTVIALAGLVMLVLPGPGLLVLGLAVAVLALEFDWAKRLAERVVRLARALADRFRRPGG
jgi:uncharacterized protein (TIGR02611 family)